MKIILVHHRSLHHAQKSGYGRMIDYMDAEVVYGETKFPYRLAKALAGLHSQKTGIYNSGSVFKSIELYRLLKKQKGEKTMVHFLNGERDICHLSFFKRKFPNVFFCATFHKPPDVLKQSIPNPSALRKLDGAIAVGNNQVEFLKEWLGLKHVQYIPHGVDADFFKPNPTLKKKNTLLFVGQHLRDFETFNKTIPILAEEIRELKVNVVLHPAYVSQIVQHSNVEVFTKVDDKDLLIFYQEATALYLPMVDSTACNSLLEAMACGLPIISSRVGGNIDYLKNTNAIFLDRNDPLEPVIYLLNQGLNLKDSAEIRARAEEFSWGIIESEIKSFYKTLINDV